MQGLFARYYLRVGDEHVLTAQGIERKGYAHVEELRTVAPCARLFLKAEVEYIAIHAQAMYATCFGFHAFGVPLYNVLGVVRASVVNDYKAVACLHCADVMP